MDVNDDNKLVSNDDLNSLSDYSEPSVENLWTNESVLMKLKDEIETLTVESKKYKLYPESVIIKAVADVIAKAGWPTVEQMNNNIQKILEKKYIPFSRLCVNKITKQRDFWIQYVLINNGKYENYSKHEVLLSKHFCEAFKEYIKVKLDNKVKFWISSSEGKGNQELDLSFVNKRDNNRLMDYNIEDLIVVRFSENKRG